MAWEYLLAALHRQSYHHIRSRMLSRSTVARPNGCASLLATEKGAALVPLQRGDVVCHAPVEQEVDKDCAAASRMSN